MIPANASGVVLTSGNRSLANIFFQWRIQEFQNGGGGGGGPGAVEFCFDAPSPSNILYVFVARVVNKIRNINIDY